VAKPRYDDSVFINCPFDSRYFRLFPALVFAVTDCGFIARCALEESDSSESRIEKLYRIIFECRYGIHDISRTELSARRLPRFNMPLELGIFLGAKKYGAGRQRSKNCLILDRTPYRYQRFCSDLAGNDPKAHGDKPRTAVIVVRNWLRGVRGGFVLPGGEAIYRRYLSFETDLPILCSTLSLNRRALEFNDLRTVIDEWLRSNPPRLRLH
jgi:hypothetical protein